MSENEDLISSLYPPPPPYFKFFTEDNKQKLESWKKDNPDTSDAEPPGELKFLVPPKQPEGTHYRGYGSLWSFEDKLPSLEDLGWKKLYESVDDHDTSRAKIQELHKLTDSLLLCFLELIGIMSIEPLQFHVKIEDLKLILININHILNTYRPHQSRESLIMLLRHKIEQKQKEISNIDETCTSIRERIQAITSQNIGVLASENSPSQQPNRKDIVAQLLEEL